MWSKEVRFERGFGGVSGERKERVEERETCRSEEVE